tara:strand:+ start:3935 stop:5191 length:1257 start_codon:yes stop_codon:yes gene_type:complete
MAILRQLNSYLSKKIGTDTSYIFRHGSWLYGLQLFAALSGFVISLALTTYLTVEEFGSYRMTLSVLAIVTIFTLPGVSVAIVRSVAQGKQLNFSKLTKSIMLWSLLGTLVAASASFYYFYVGNWLLGSALLIIALILPMSEGFSIYVPYLRGKKEFGRSSVRQGVVRLIQTTAVIITAIITANWVLCLLALLLSKTLVDLYFYYYTFDTKALKKEPETDEVLTYGKKLTFTNAVVMLSEQLDKLFIWHYIGASTLAYYSIAQIIPNTLAGFSNLIPQLALPKFANRNWSNRHEQSLLLNKIKKASLALALYYFIYLQVIPVFIKFVFPDYTESIPAAYITGLVVIFTPIQNLLKQVFYASGKARITYQIAWFELISLGILMLSYMWYGSNSLVLFALLIPVKQLLGIGCSIWFLRYRL